MCFLKPILSSHKLMLLIFLIHIAESDIPFDFEDFIVGYLSTYRRHWPLEPGNTAALRNVSIKFIENSNSDISDISDVFDCYVLLFRDLAIIIEVGKIILVTKIQGVTQFKNETTNLDVPCYLIELDSTKPNLHIFTSRDTNGVDHLFGFDKEMRPYLLDDLILKCDTTLLDEIYAKLDRESKQDDTTVSCFQNHNPISFGFYNSIVHCITSGRLDSIVRVCGNGKTTKQYVLKELDSAGKSGRPEFSTILNTPEDTFLYIVYDNNSSYAYRMSKIDAELTEVFRRCFGNVPFIVNECEPRNYTTHCYGPGTITHYMDSFKIPFGEMVDMITFQQEIPIKFTKIFIPELNRATLITVYESKDTQNGLAYKIVHKNIKLPTKHDIKIIYYGHSFRYFVRGSNKTVPLPEIGLPCVILDPLYCFLFEKDLKCRYIGDNDFCLKNEKPSNIAKLETDSIHFSIRPRSSPSMKNRSVVLRSTPTIFYNWILKKYAVKLRLIIDPSGYIALKKFLPIKLRDSEKDLYTTKLSFTRIKKPKPRMPIKIKLAFEFTGANKTLTTKNYQTIYLEDPLLSEIIPNHVFTRFRNARFNILFYANPSYFDKISFGFDDSTSFTKHEVKPINKTINLYQQTVILEREFPSPKQLNVTIIYDGDVYSVIEFKVVEKPKLPEKLTKTIFSEAGFNLTWKDPEFKTFFTLEIGVINNENSKIMTSPCQVKDIIICPYPKLSQIVKAYRTNLDFYSHQARLNEGNLNQLVYLPVPFDLYAFTAENWIKLSGVNLHYTYPLELILTNSEDKEELNCSRIDYKIVHDASGNADFTCYLNESLHNSTHWMLSVKIGDWSADPLNVKLIPKPLDDPAFFKSLQLILSFLIILFVAFAMVMRFAFKTKLKAVINLRKLRFRVSRRRKRPEKTIPSTENDDNDKLKNVKSNVSINRMQLISKSAAFVNTTKPSRSTKLKSVTSGIESKSKVDSPKPKVDSTKPKVVSPKKKVKKR